MLRNLINSIIVFFEPSYLIPRKDWLDIWISNEKNKLSFSARIFTLSFGIIVALHYPLIDIPAKKEPLELWFYYRASVSAVLFFAFGFSFIKKISQSSLAYFPTLIAAIYLVYMQGQSMIWRPQVPFFYVPLLALISTLVLRLSAGKSIFVFTLITAITYEPFIKRPQDSHHLVSASIVCIALLVMFRTTKKLDVQTYILENTNKETQKKLIQTQIEMSDQLRAFLPTVIYQRVSDLVNKSKKTPLQAADEVLRPRKVIGSVLFSDIRGFTGIIKSKGEDIALNSIIPAQKECTDLVEKNNGIPRLQGDLVFAYYDSNNAIENLVNSVNTAIQIVQSTDSLNNRIQNYNTNVTRYIIISYGQVLVGNLGGTNGSRDISVIGNAANIPSRIDTITKDSKIKELLIDAPIILTKAANDELISNFSGVITQKVDLNELQISLRDFPNETQIFLISRKNFNQVVNLLNMKQAYASEMAA